MRQRVPFRSPLGAAILLLLLPLFAAACRPSPAPESLPGQAPQAIPQQPTPTRPLASTSNAPTVPAVNREETPAMPGLPVSPEPTEVGSDPEDPQAGVVEPGLEGFVKEGREDLAGRLSISVDQIELLAARPVVWPDGSLGCPQPGMAYKQVPQEGVLVRLGVGGKVYNYHGGGSRGLFLCQQELNPGKPLPGPGHGLPSPPKDPNE